MRRLLLLITMVGAVLLACTGLVLAQDDQPAPLRPAEDEEERIPDEYIVQFEKTTKNPDRVARQIARKNGLELKHVYKDAIKGFAAPIPQASLEAVRKDPRVRVVEEDTQMRIAAQTMPTGVDRMEAESSGATGADGTRSVNVGVAVIDTGIDLKHPDLNAINGTNAISSNADPDCTKNRPSGDASDDNGHGTHVAGTIGAKDNQEGVVGVAPGATVHAVKVLNSAGSGSRSDVICGIDWVTKNAGLRGIKVANMSLGGSGSDDGKPCGDPAITDLYKQAICKSTAAGVTYVVAAGNSGVDLKDQVPAAYDNVLTVTALADFDGKLGGGAAATCRSDVDDTAADFSNYATTAADQSHTIAAPGVCIESTWMNGGYNTISGTSMASPHVAGMAALYMAEQPVRHTRAGNEHAPRRRQYQDR